jgi:hypothetical protein
MSTGNGRPLGCPPHKHSKTAVAQPGDEQLTWSRKRLQKMNACFTRRLEWAFQWGHEHRSSAANEVELPMSSAPHFSAPICPDAGAALLRSSIPAPVPK